MPLLTACAGSPVVQEKTEYRYPPKSLMRECPEPVYSGKLWKDLAEHAIQQQAVIAGCNADKAALREWRRAAEEEQANE